MIVNKPDKEVHHQYFLGEYNYNHSWISLLSRITDTSKDLTIPSTGSDLEQEEFSYTADRNTKR